MVKPTIPKLPTAHSLMSWVVSQFWLGRSGCVGALITGYKAGGSFQAGKPAVWMVPNSINTSPGLFGHLAQQLDCAQDIVLDMVPLSL